MGIVGKITLYPIYLNIKKVNSLHLHLNTQIKNLKRKLALKALLNTCI